ncbi:MAG: hypothetical protein ACI4HQ_08535, partial [Acetatifactor sp.]
MDIAVSLVYIVAFSLGIAVLFRRRIEEVIAPSIFFIIIILYFCGMFFGTFMVGVYMCCYKYFICHICFNESNYSEKYSSTVLLDAGN